MKERFLLTVSWGAFAWAAYICLALALNADNLGRLVSQDEFLLAAAISPAVWLVLWIVTGSPRILPWRK